MKCMILIALIFVTSTVQAHANNMPIQVSAAITTQIADLIGRQPALATFRLVDLRINEKGTAAAVNLKESSGRFCVNERFQVYYREQGVPLVVKVLEKWGLCEANSY